MRKLLLISFLSVALAACGSDEATVEGPALAPPDADTGHVHAVGVDPQDGSTYVAAHTGLFRAPAGAPRASRVGDERRDVMGFTVVGPGQFAGSGHPDVRQGGASSVGYIRSQDGGRSWQTVSLSGEADLHALEVAGSKVYAFDAIEGAFRVSQDAGRTWRSTVVPPVLDLAVDPGDDRTVVVSTQEGVLRSTDAGKSFRPYASSPPSQLVWTPDGLTALGLDGVVRRLDAEGGKTLGQLEQPPAAATTHEGAILVAMDDGSVIESTDGRTWRPRLGPTAG